ncbi:MAG TPA: hypothetical protein VGS04_03060 [Nitrososphaerales archaeon]|nr:hypothetical protein [Nitrososphaerales archaeon]
MQKRLPKLVRAGMLVLLMLSFLGATPALAQCVIKPGHAECIAPLYAVPAEPVWATLNAATSDNYPGGNETFNVFVINSDVPPKGNVTVYNETITATALPPALNTSRATGLPMQLSPGQAITSTITLPIPNDFKPNNFTASLVVNVSYWNGTTDIPVKLSGATAIVYILGAPLAGASTASTATSQTTATPTQGGTVSTGLFAAAVAIPSVVAVILIALLVRRSGPKRGT